MAQITVMMAQMSGSVMVTGSMRPTSTVLSHLNGLDMEPQSGGVLKVSTHVKTGTFKYSLPLVHTSTILHEQPLFS